MEPRRSENGEPSENNWCLRSGSVVYQEEYFTQADILKDGRVSGCLTLVAPYLLVFEHMTPFLSDGNEAHFVQNLDAL